MQGFKLLGVPFVLLVVAFDVGIVCCKVFYFFIKLSWGFIIIDDVHWRLLKIKCSLSMGNTLVHID
jgi:hypothetical protein